MELTTTSLEEFKGFAERTAASFAALPPRNAALVVALSGELGAGKTAFSQFLAAAGSVRETVQSPTFVIMKTYGISLGNFKRLVHIDAYRIEDPAELERLGWETIIADPENLVLVEWPELIPELIPADAARIAISHGAEEGTRNLSSSMR